MTMKIIDRWSQSLLWKRLPHYPYIAIDIVERDVFLGDYWRAVEAGKPRQDLSEILAGLAGCELASAYLADDIELKDEHRRCALLILEISYAAKEGYEYHPQCPDFETEPIGVALQNLAVAYAARDEGTATDELIGNRLNDLANLLPTDVLPRLMRAHGHIFRLQWKTQETDEVSAE